MSETTNGGVAQLSNGHANPTRQITIQGMLFDISSPYTVEKLSNPGVYFSKEELVGMAATLNQTRGENIRNNNAKIVERAVEKAKAEGRQITPEEMAELQAAVSKVDAEYKFGTGQRGAHGPKDPVKDKAYAMIADHVRALAESKGRKLTAKAVTEWQDKFYASQTDKWRAAAEKELARIAREAKRTVAAEGDDLEAALGAALAG